MCHIRHSLSCTYTATNMYAVCNAMSHQFLNYSLACRDAGSNQLASIQSMKLDSNIVYYVIVWCHVRCQVRMSLYEASSLSSHFGCWFFRISVPSHAPMMWSIDCGEVYLVGQNASNISSGNWRTEFKATFIGALEFRWQLAKLAVNVWKVSSTHSKIKDSVTYTVVKNAVICWQSVDQSLFIQS